MEEAPKTRRFPLLVALAGVILLAAIWATMALAGGLTGCEAGGEGSGGQDPVREGAARVRRQLRRRGLPEQGPGSSSDL